MEVKVKLGKNQNNNIGIPHSKLSQESAMRLLKSGISLGILRAGGDTQPRILYRVYRINDIEVFVESFDNSTDNRVLKGNEIKNFLDVESHTKRSGQEYFLAILHYNS
ncbi:hypothetical protein V6O07_19750, partial [Arthrospira platensis SPKY2]